MVDLNDPTDAVSTCTGAAASQAGLVSMMSVPLTAVNEEGDGGFSDEPSSEARRLTSDLPPVMRRPLHWRVVRPGRGDVGDGGITEPRAGGGGGESTAGQSRSSNTSSRCVNGRKDGGGVLSSFDAASAASGGDVPRSIGLTSRRRGGSLGRVGFGVAGSSVGSTVGTETTVSSLRSAPSMGMTATPSAASSGEGSSSSLFDAFSVGSGSSKGVKLAGPVAPLYGGVRRAFGKQHRFRTLLLLSAAAVVGTSLSLLTSHARHTRGFASVGLRQGRRSLFSLENRHLDRYPFTNLADTSTLVDPKSEVAFYWQIPRSGGTTLKHVVGSCLGLVQASRTARDYCDMEKNALETCDTKFGRFVNADPSDDPGIMRAKELGLAGSGLVDVAVSSRFLHAAGLFDAGNKEDDGGDKADGDKEKEGGGERRRHLGRAFTVLRHPADRSASTFHYLRHATWERNYNPEFNSISLVEWTQREDTARDWTVRWLTGNNHEAELTQSDLEFAKEVLRRKFLILLTDDLPAGVDRLIRYMGWETTKTQRKCARGAAIKAAAKNAASDAGEAFQKVERESEEYRALESINKFDIELYEYARRLYDEQWKTIFLEGKALKIRGDDDGEGPGVGGYGADSVPSMAESLAAAFEGGKTSGLVAPNTDSSSAAPVSDEASPPKAKDAVRDGPSTSAALEAAEKRSFGVSTTEKESLPAPPEMARLAALFDPVDDMDSSYMVGTKKNAEEGAEKKDSGSGGNGATKNNNAKKELPVPPEMARLAAAFESGGGSEA